MHGNHMRSNGIVRFTDACVWPLSDRCHCEQGVAQLEIVLRDLPRNLLVLGPRGLLLPSR